LTVALASLQDNLQNGATYVGNILHADLHGTCEGHGLGLMSIGVIIGKKIVLLKQRFSVAVAYSLRTGGRSMQPQQQHESVSSGR